MNKSKYDLRWGESVAIRQSLVETLPGSPVIFDMDKLKSMGYPPHNGNDTLIEMTRKVIKRQVGLDYKHILLTNGATGGITISLRLFKQLGYQNALVSPAPYFPLYPDMIKASGLEKIEKDVYSHDPSSVLLIDSPSNPVGRVISATFDSLSMPIVFDAVYHNNVYTNGKIKAFNHDIIVGSYSKLLGLNGIRMGWIATNDSSFYKKLIDLVTAEYAGLSDPSSTILLDILKNFNWDGFEFRARNRLDLNREEWSKLEKFFPGNFVQPLGMFFYGKMDRACKRLMDRSNVVWMPGSSCGTDDTFGRFNLGQDCRVIKNSVKEILKNDKRV